MEETTKTDVVDALEKVMGAVERTDQEKVEDAKLLGELRSATSRSASGEIQVREAHGGSGVLGVAIVDADGHSADGKIYKLKTPADVLADNYRKPPRYALDGAGEKIVVSTLKNGTKVYAAAGDDGKPLFVNGFAGVIDPYTGRLRFKVKHTQVQSPEAVFDAQNGLSLAQRCLAVHDPSEIAFAKAVVPVKDLYRKWTRAERAKKRVLLFVASLVVAARKFVARFKRAPKLPPPMLIIEKLDVVIPATCSKEIKSKWYEVDGPNKLAFARFFAMRVPLNPDGSVPQALVDRFRNFIGAMACDGLFKYGHLAPPSVISVPLTNTRYEKMLFGAFFTDQIPEDDYGEAAVAKALNAKVGFPIFVEPGFGQASNDWASFPW